jgi:hypothetical protein
VNDTLRRALADARLGEVEVSSALGVDPKTVQRWVAGRLPQRRHRWALADLVGQHELDLWPALTRGQVAQCPEIMATYVRRSAVPRDEWHQLFSSAEREIGVLAYSGLFFAEDVEVLRTLSDRAHAGVRVRLLLGDADSPEVASRGAEEGIGEAMAAKVRNALVHLGPVAEVEGIELRLHRTVLYNSLYRADDELLVNIHVHGVPAAHAPVLHLHARDDRDLTTTYLESFERIWTQAAPYRG